MAPGPASVPSHGARTRLSEEAVVAIDGPAGSGKSTTAKALARRFDLLYIDSGAMYRALAWAALRAGIDADDAAALTALLRSARLELRSSDKEATVVWNGRDVSRPIRAPEVDRVVSRVSAHPAVRRDMVERQREFGRRGGVVMEGRDIGSVVFPLATTKIFLDAGLAARVERRYRQFRERGEAVERGAVERELVERDRLDRERAESPLTISPDAFVLDTSDWSLDDQIRRAGEVCAVNPALDRELDTDAESARRGMPWKYRFAYGLLDAAARFFGVRQVGYEGEAVPRGTILACNHVHWYDPPIVGSTLRRWPVHTLAKEELFAGAGGPFFRWLDAIPIHRKGYDQRAFGRARRALAAGANIFIFPEGTRRVVGRPGPVKNGLGILVQETGAPIQPLFIRGTWALAPGGSPRSPLEVRFGPVLRLHALAHLQARMDRREVSRRIAQLCEAAFCELQALSYAERPETAFERALAERLAARFDAKHRRLFGAEEGAEADR
jgi:cytidylate kinase